MASVSCQKSIEPANPAEEGKETIDICVNGLMGEYTQVDGTKAKLVNTVRVSWEGDETVYVYDGTQCLGSLAASLEGTEDRYAILSTDGTHTVSTPAAGTTTLTLVYSPLLTEAPAVSNDAISISLASQSGAKAPFVAYATLEYTGTTIKNVVVPFQFATSVIKVNCTGLKARTAITSATLSNVNTACKLTLSGSAAPTVSGGTNGTITRTGDEYFAAEKVNSEGVAVFQIAAPKLEEASEVRVLTIAQGSDEFEYKNFSKKALSAATSVNTVCQLVKALPAGALPGVFTVSDDNGVTKTPIHFSQGNLYYDGSKFNFEANQYSFNSSYQSTYVSHFFWSKDASVACAGTYSESGTTGTDVFFTNVNGFKVNVGGKEQSGWRNLSTNEWQYLFNTRTVNGGQGAGKSYSLNITYGGKRGLVLYPDDYSGSTLTSGTDYTDANFPADCVFLPAAGFRSGSNVKFVGSGYYWPSTAKDGGNAYYVLFNSSDVIYGKSVGRFGGYSVRLITESK